jgi:hypothetical protein
VIDIEIEDVFPLTEVPEVVARLRGGRRVNLATVHRWTMAGCRGRKLEFLQVGGTRCTSLQALQRFFAGTTAADRGPEGRGRGPGLGRRPASAARRHAQAVDRQLEELGL